MKIVLATLNSKYIHSNLSLWCLKAGVCSFCSDKHNIKVIESTINGNMDAFITDILSYAPDVIAFSCYIWNIEHIISVCKIIGHKHKCTIVLGGPEVEYRQRELLENNRCVDFILQGEGEWSFSSLIDCLAQGSDFSSCRGISYIDNGMFITNEAEKITATPPSPYCDEYFRSLHGRISYIEASRGCPYKCTYCLSGQLKGLRYFDYEQVCSDIIKLSVSGTKTIKFIDRTFNADAKKANAILQFIITNAKNFVDKGICFHFEIAADILHETTMTLLTAMPVGLCQLEIGIQSFNKDTLSAVKRKADSDRISACIIRLIKNGNIHIHTDLIAGLPYEDLNSFKNSFNNAFSMRPHMLQLGFLKLLYGAEIKNNVKDFGYVYSDLPPYEVKKTKWLSDEDIAHIKACESVLDRLYNSGRFLLTTEYLLDSTEFDAFDLFSSFGKAYSFENVSLSEFAEYIFNHFRTYCNADKLKENILCDLASIPANIKIPEIFAVYDPRYKTLKKYFTEKLKKNIRLVILNSTNEIFVVHTDNRNRINGRFYSEKYDMPEI